MSANSADNSAGNSADNPVDKDATVPLVGNTPVDNAVINDAVETALEELLVKPPTACGLNITERAHEMNNVMLEGARLGIQAALW